MNSDLNMMDVLRTVSGLLVQAERAPASGERAAALNKLTTIHAELMLRLTEAETGTTPDMRRTVEIASLRAAVSTLKRELDIIGEAKASQKTG
jgi:hypothetical protein